VGDCFKFCGLLRKPELYLGYFSLASVGVRSDATHLQPNLYHNLVWKNRPVEKSTNQNKEQY